MQQRPVGRRSALRRVGLAIALAAATAVAAVGSAAAAETSPWASIGGSFKPGHAESARGSWGGPGWPGGGGPVTGLNAPFGIAVDLLGRVYVAEAGIGDEANIAPGRILRASGGQVVPLVVGSPFATDVDAFGSMRSGLGWLLWGGVGVNAFDSFAYTWGGTGTLGVRTGNVTRTFDLGAYEAANNPDQGTTYGPTIDIESLVTPACWAGLSDELKQIVSPYNGIVDSNPFRTTFLPDGSRAVADAAGNTIVRVQPNGSISTLVVLPPNVVHVPPDVLSGPLTEDGQTLPDCVLDALPEDGFDYRFEPVPTGIAVGPDGHLYVGELPGGELPGEARVVRVNLLTKQVDTFATGFSAITDITFGNDGTLYVTELFDGRVMRIPTTRSHAGLVAGTPSVLAEVPLPNGLATAPDGTIYASILSLTAEGQVVPLGR